MDLTISMNTVLNFLHSMALSTSNKQWLADHLYEEVKAERKAAATANNGWPKIRRENMRISPEVMKRSSRTFSHCLTISTMTRHVWTTYLKSMDDEESLSRHQHPH